MNFCNVFGEKGTVCFQTLKSLLTILYNAWLLCWQKYKWRKQSKFFLQNWQDFPFHFIKPNMFYVQTAHNTKRHFRSEIVRFYELGTSVSFCTSKNIRTRQTWTPRVPNEAQRLRKKDKMFDDKTREGLSEMTSPTKWGPWASTHINLRIIWQENICVWPFIKLNYKEKFKNLRFYN